MQLSHNRQIPLQSSYLCFNNQLLKVFCEMLCMGLLQRFIIAYFCIVTTFQCYNNIAISKKV